MVQIRFNVGEASIYFLAPEFHRFYCRQASPLGRLGASRPPAAGEGFPEEASPGG